MKIVAVLGVLEGDKMIARLNKKQAKMLLDGKRLTYGHSEYGISEGDSDIRTILEDFANDGAVMSIFDVFVNVEKGCLEFKQKQL